MDALDQAIEQLHGCNANAPSIAAASDLGYARLEKVALNQGVTIKQGIADKCLLL